MNVFRWGPQLQLGGSSALRGGLRPTNADSPAQRNAFFSVSGGQQASVSPPPPNTYQAVCVICRYGHLLVVWGRAHSRRVRSPALIGQLQPELVHLLHVSHCRGAEEKQRFNESLWSPKVTVEAGKRGFQTCRDVSSSKRSGGHRSDCWKRHQSEPKTLNPADKTLISTL